MYIFSCSSKEEVGTLGPKSPVAAHPGPSSDGGAEQIVDLLGGSQGSAISATDEERPGFSDESVFTINS